jgi:hypothetical protein
MIAATAYLLIAVIVLGLLVLGLLWVIETLFKLTIPAIVKQALGLIALILVVLRLLQIWGAA